MAQVFNGQEALSITQPTVSKHWRTLTALALTKENHTLASSLLHPSLDSSENGRCCLYASFPMPTPSQIQVLFNFDIHVMQQQTLYQTLHTNEIKI